MRQVAARAGDAKGPAHGLAWHGRPGQARTGQGRGARPAQNSRPGQASLVPVPRARDSLEREAVRHVTQVQAAHVESISQRAAVRRVRAHVRPERVPRQADQVPVGSHRLHQLLLERVSALVAVQRQAAPRLQRGGARGCAVLGGVEAWSCGLGGIGLFFFVGVGYDECVGVGWGAPRGGMGCATSSPALGAASRVHLALAIATLSQLPLPSLHPTLSASSPSHRGPVRATGWAPRFPRPVLDPGVPAWRGTRAQLAAASVPPRPGAPAARCAPRGARTCGQGRAGQGRGGT